MDSFWKSCGSQPSDSAIMKSLDSMILNNRSIDDPNYECSSLYKNPPLYFSIEKCYDIKSFLLLDEQANLNISDAENFLQKLNCFDKNIKVKVVSIFGNIGNGKSYTMNQTFFNGKEVFKTLNKQSCTRGVWVAFDPVLNVICLDTEGLLGITNYGDECASLILKVLAVSDIIIYRTRSERLTKELFTFLGTASCAYRHYFQTALQMIGQQEEISFSLNTFGPSVIVLQETMHTRPLTNNGSESAEDVLRNRFVQMGFEIEAFSSIKYVGQQLLNHTTNYELLQSVIKNELNNTTVRSARKPSLVYNILETLNDKSPNNIENFSNILFPDQYFTCTNKCLSCGCRCDNSMGHLHKGKSHVNDITCKFQHQYENMIYLCKKCYDDGNEVQVSRQVEQQNESSWYSLAKYAWSGYIIECPHCGEIYKSRQYWYGNKDPEEEAVHTKITHVWSMKSHSMPSQNTAQRVIDGVTYFTEAVTNVSLQPTKALSAWVADQVAPSYWRPNSEIKYCYQCKNPFGLTDPKHHCRDCGEGFCSQCSSKTKCVPHKNWNSPVRVCDACYDKETNSNDNSLESTDVNIRKVSEHVVSTFTAVGTVLNYSKSLIKDSVRPTYWVPDTEIVNCCICEQKFSIALPVHHCRDCGRGVCHECSQHRKPVLYRGWDKPVRVCDACIKID